MIRVIEGNILEQISQAPAMYLGERSLTALYHFLHGYMMAANHYQPGTPSLLPTDFHDWVAYRLHFKESTSGYRSMILSQIPNESDALDKFIELLDEHAARKPVTVARVQCHPQGFKIKRQTKYSDGTLSDIKEIPCAEFVSIVVFTNDPGFFVVNEEPQDYPRKIEFCYSFTWMHPPYTPDLEFTTVLNQGEFDRLMAEARVAH